MMGEGVGEPPGLGEGELMAGWLVKSPPLENKKSSFNPLTPKWRRRWFVLRESGMPGQYILNYYTDSTARKLKGSIDLDQCHQVDCGLTYRCGKISRSNLFNIQTKQRIYYLSADTLEEMNSWVQSLCQACGLRPYQSEEDEGKEAQGLQEASPESPQSNTNQTTISGPYMHLSECFTGGGPPSKHVRGSEQSSSRPAPDSFLSYGDDSVFSSSSLSGNKTLPRCDEDLPSQFSTLQVGGSYIPPSRPPKPAGLRNQPVQLQNADGENYENFQSAQKMSQLANQRESNINNNNNNNAVPSQLSSPSSLPVNLLASAPPQVDRRLKPFRKYSQGESATLPPGGFHPAAPNMQNSHSQSIRRIHNHHPSDQRLGNMERVSSEESINSRRNSEEEETIYFYMPSLQNGDDGRYPIMIPEKDMIGQSVEYLDLDLPSPDTKRTDTKPNEDSSSTIYKTVDFFKTEAFNRTKKSVEHERYNMPPS